MGVSLTMMALDVVVGGPDLVANARSAVVSTVTQRLGLDGFIGATVR